MMTQLEFAKMFSLSLINSISVQENALISRHLLRYSWNNLLHL